MSSAQLSSKCSRSVSDVNGGKKEELSLVVGGIYFQQLEA